MSHWLTLLRHIKRIMHDALIVEMEMGDANQFEKQIEDYNFAINIEKVNG